MCYSLFLYIYSSSVYNFPPLFCGLFLGSMTSISGCSSCPRNFFRSLVGNVVLLSFKWVDWGFYAALWLRDHKMVNSGKSWRSACPRSNKTVSHWVHIEIGAISVCSPCHSTWCFVGSFLALWLSTSLSRERLRSVLGLLFSSYSFPVDYTRELDAFYMCVWGNFIP